MPASLLRALCSHLCLTPAATSTVSMDLALPGLVHSDTLMVFSISVPHHPGTPLNHPAAAARSPIRAANLPPSYLNRVGMPVSLSRASCLQRLAAEVGDRADQSPAHYLCSARGAWRSNCPVEAWPHCHHRLLGAGQSTCHRSNARPKQPGGWPVWTPYCNKRHPQAAVPCAGTPPTSHHAT